MTEQPESVQNELSENEQIAERKNKLRLWREEEKAYPNDFKRDALALDLHKQWYAVSEEDLENAQHTVYLAGRIMTRRLMGKASFIHLQDMSGKIQCYITQNIIGKKLIRILKSGI